MRVLFEEYKPIFSAMSDCLTAFEQNGFDSTAGDSVIKLLANSENTPLSDVLRVSSDIEKLAVILGTLVNFSRRAADTVSRLFSVRPGSITPEAVCELFVGVSDIFPICEYLSQYSILDRVFDGTAPRQNAVMTLKPFAAQFIADGEIDDDLFMPSDSEDLHYIRLSENDRAEKEIAAVTAAVHRNSPLIVAVCGEEGCGRRTAAGRALEAAGIDHVVVRSDARADSERIKDLSTKLFWLGALPVVIQSENTSSESFIRFVNTLVENIGTIIVLCGQQQFDDPLSAEVVRIRIDQPSTEEQYSIWENEMQHYKTDGSVDISELVGEFSFTVGGIKKALRFAKMFSKADVLTFSDIKAGCCRSVNSDMGSKAVKINCVFGWDDIVLPEHSKRLMKTACDQVRYRHRVYDQWGFADKIAYGRSVSMIFTGPPGTGKTMAAQIIAAELGLDIYRISLANVVSKYIGETEKNLDEIFEKAKKSKVVLFFDEADVLFSKRTEVKDSNDKYSNMESAFLLQKIEEYHGIVILATNLVQNFDEAFKRRMKLMIDFPFPDAQRRAEMWKRAFPEKLPLGSIDYDYLVNNFELSGSNIKNIALHSAFLAAAEGSEEVSMKHIIASLKNEYAKSGKAFTKTDAGEYYYYLDE